MAVSRLRPTQTGTGPVVWRKGAAAFQMATLLMPRSGGQGAVPRVSPVLGGNGDVVGVNLPDEDK